MTRWRTAVVLLAVLAAMGAVLANGLVYDAAYLLHSDARLAAPIDWPGLLTERYWSYSLYRPLTLVVLGVQAWAGGGTMPSIFQATSLFLYAATALLLLRMLDRFAVPATAALLVTVLFAVHPVHVEVVASVVGQAELLVAIAFVVAILTWDRAGTDGARPRHLGILVLAVVTAAFAKEQGFLLPLVLLGQSILMPRTLPRATRARWLCLLSGISAVLWALHWQVTGSAAGEVPAAALAALRPGERALVSLGILPEMLRLLVFPLHLRAEYTPPELVLTPSLGWRPLVGGALVALGALALWRWRRTRPLAAFGVWLAGVTWLPVSSLVVPAGLLLGERVLFLPSLGLAIAAGGWLVPGARLAPTSLRLGWVVVALFAGRSALRCGAWHDQARFFEAMVHDAPRAYRAWLVRGTWQVEAGDLAGAEASLRRAHALWPHDPMVPDALGQLLRREGRCDEAIPVMREGLALAPDRTPLRARLGECLLAVGDRAAAASLAREAIARGETEFSGLLDRATSRVTADSD